MNSWILCRTVEMLRINWLWQCQRRKDVFAVKKREQDHNFKPNFSFVDSLVIIHRIRKKISQAKAECRANDNIRQHAHNFGDFVFYKSMSFRSSFLGNLVAEKNKELNQKARKITAEYYLEVLLLQYNTLLFNCEKRFAELINDRLFVDFIVLNTKSLISTLIL